MRRVTRTQIVLGLIAAVVVTLIALLWSGEPSDGSAAVTSPEPAPVSAVASPPTPDAPPVESRTVALGIPERVEVPAIEVDVALGSVGLLDDGAMETPDFGAAAWYRPGPKPGDAGGAVLVAHVRGPDGPDVFRDLVDLRPGDEITVHGSRGTATYVVTDVEDVPKEQLPYDRIWPETDRSLLRLITCGGQPDPNGGGFPDNTVVYADLVPEKSSKKPSEKL